MSNYQSFISVRENNADCVFSHVITPLAHVAHGVLEGQPELTLLILFLFQFVEPSGSRFELPLKLDGDGDGDGDGEGKNLGLIQI